MSELKASIDAIGREIKKLKDDMDWLKRDFEFKLADFGRRIDSLEIQKNGGIKCL
jgi:hypothetical protein